MTISVAPYQDTAIKQILSQRDETKRNTLIKLWHEAKIVELNIVTLTSTLIVAVVCSAFSWYDTTTSPWSTLACWIAALVLGVASIGTASQQTLGFSHMKSTPGYEDEIRQFLGQGFQDASGRTEWRATYSHIYVLQIPTMFLKLAITLFLLGLGLTVWDAAGRVAYGLRKAETKIAIVYTVALIFCVVNYFVSSWFLYRRTLKSKIA